MSETFRRVAFCVGWTVTAAGLLGPAAAAAFAADAQGVLLRRKITGDEPIVMPVMIGREKPSSQPESRGCPAQVERAPLDAEVQVWLTAQMARRDEPSWSLILRLDERRAYLLYHHDRLFNELSYPPGKKDFWGSYRRSLDEAEVERVLAARAGPPASSTEVRVARSRVPRRQARMVRLPL